MIFVSTSRRQLFLFFGITLFVLASAIGMLLLQEKYQRALSDMAGNHQLVVVNSVKIKEELANMQLYLLHLSSAGVDSGTPSRDLYGGRFNPAISRYSLRLHFDRIESLLEKTDSSVAVFTKLKSQIGKFPGTPQEFVPADSEGLKRTLLALQSLVLTTGQLEDFHNLKLKELTEKLESMSQRNNRNLIMFLLALSFFSFVLIWLAVRSINRSVKNLHLSEQELKRSQQQLNNLLEALPDAVIRVSSAGEILESRGNQSFAGDDGDIVGERLADIEIPEGVRNGLAKAIETALSSAGIVIYEYDLAADGQTYEARINRFRGDEAIVIVRNITEQEKVRKQQDLLTAELENKNAELERFVYTVSHDLKSPLVTIKGYVGMIEKAIETDDARQIDNDLTRIAEATDNMSDLLDGLLELSRIGRVVNPPEAGALGELAHKAAGSLRHELAARGVRLEIDDEMPQYWGDALRLLEVFQNLIENSIKFMGDQPQPRIRISAIEKDGKITCRVQDNGIGIDPKFQDRIFNLFERLDPGIEGTGIGMALVQRIVEAHGGTIRVESGGNRQGCTIVFTLPVKPGQPDRLSA